MQTDASVHILFIRLENASKQKAKQKHDKKRWKAKKRYLECVKWKRMTAVEPFSLFHFFMCWEYHPSKTYFFVKGFALMSPPQRQALWAIDSGASAQRTQNSQSKASPDLSTLYDHHTLPRVFSEQFLLLQNASYFPSLWSRKVSSCLPWFSAVVTCSK